MHRPTLHLAAALAVLLWAPTTAPGQEPAPAELRAVAIAEGETVELVYAWRFHPGDDPRWAGPARDDRNWERVLPLLPPDGLPRGGWPGTGWFRRHLRIEPALYDRPLVIRLETSGATTVYLDGAPLLDAAALELTRRAGATAGASREVVVSPRPDHVLAVRHTFSPGGRMAPRENLGFRLSFEAQDAAVLQLAAVRRDTIRRSVFTALPAFLALLHLALFLSYPRARENLFYALTMAAFASIVLSEQRPAPAASADLPLLSRLATSFVLAAIFLLLLTYYAVRTHVFPRTWRVFAAAGAALSVLAFLRPQAAGWIWYAYFGLMIAEVVRLEMAGKTIEREGVHVLLGGFTILGTVILLQILIELGAIPPIAGARGIYVYGLLAFAVSMSLFLSQSFARTRTHLEQRLAEVSVLSQQVLDQERTAHEQDLRRHLLEIENERKSAEIERARILQLSMRPASLPVVDGLDTAAVMLPATEVGGDYYDFRITADGSLVVAFGDATGHGVAAGIMVTAIKALFSTLGGAESLPSVLAECDRVLREMQVKPLHMCLALARLTPRSVTLCSAAMPPVLIHRAGTGTVEELGTGGPPVGSRLAGPWREHHAALAPGDTLLFASDGFAEQLDTADNPFGYEKAADAFRTAAETPVPEIIERLLARVAAWRGDREQGDDITFVVVRVSMRSGPGDDLA